MSSIGKRLRTWAEEGRPRSIVGRTTLAILGLALFVGVVFASFGWRSIEEREEERAELRLRELVATVENTAQIACFLKDRTLANEIARGLMSNRTVAGVRIAAGGVVLAETGRASTARLPGEIATLVTQPVASPFDPEVRVGAISLYVARDRVQSDAAAYGAEVALLLALQAALAGAGVAFAVYVYVTRPIRRVSNELHSSHARGGTHLRIPPPNRLDELGRLVEDVNTLIADLTTLVASERKLRLGHEVGERKMRLIFEKAATGLFVLTAEGVIQSCNPAFVQILGLAGLGPAEVCGKHLTELLPAHRECIERLIRGCGRAGAEYEADLRLSGEGELSEVWVEISVSEIGPGLVQGVVNDISERKHNELSARRLAAHDALTGLLNRHGMTATVGAAFARLTSESSPPSVALMQIDLDYFKQVNDTYGHEAGDHVLCHIARALERSVRRADLIARPGGDEFVVALVGINSAEKAREIAQRVIGEIRKPIDLGEGRSARVGASIGIAFPVTAEETPVSVMRRADAAMYTAKQRGRGQVAIAPHGEEVAA